VKRRVFYVAVLLTVAPCAADAAAEDFRWSVPAKLTDTGVDTAARNVDEAAKPPGTVIALRPCRADATWKLDGEDVAPDMTDGRCVLDLGDNSEHELSLDGGDEAPVQARDFLIVSIGDSVASGEGNPDDGSLVHPHWLEARCHRSMRSGAAQAALALEAGSPHSAVTFLPIACSGATVDAGLLGRYAGVQPDHAKPDFPPQVDELAKLNGRRSVDALLLSIGANDVNFADVAIFCARPRPRCQDDRFDPDGPRGPVAPGTADEVEAAAIAELPRRYDMLDAAVDAADIASDHVVVTEYFDPTHDEDGDTCAHVLPFVDRVEAEWAQTDVVTPLNEQVRAAALRHGWRLISGVQEAFETHGICARPRAKRWVVQIPDSVLRGARFSGPLHPNESGHQATAAMIGPVLASAIGFEGGTAAAHLVGSNTDGGIEWLQVVAGLVIGAVLGAGLALAIGRLRASQS
jgi:hypothetical protein